MPGVTVKEMKFGPTKYEDVFWSYEEIEEVFGDDPDCLVMQLLKRVKELEEEAREHNERQMVEG
jgi:hypothetical protein